MSAPNWVKSGFSSDDISGGGFQPISEAVRISQLYAGIVPGNAGKPDNVFLLGTLLGDSGATYEIKNILGDVSQVTPADNNGAPASSGYQILTNHAIAEDYKRKLWNKRSGVAFLEALGKAGVPQQFMKEGDLSKFVGTRMTTVVLEEEGQPDESGNPRKFHFNVPGQVLELPPSMGGGQPAGAAAPAPVANPAPVPTAAPAPAPAPAAAPVAPAPAPAAPAAPPAAPPPAPVNPNQGVGETQVATPPAAPTQESAPAQTQEAQQQSNDSQDDAMAQIQEVVVSILSGVPDGIQAAELADQLYKKVSADGILTSARSIAAMVKNFKTGRGKYWDGTGGGSKFVLTPDGSVNIAY